MRLALPHPYTITTGIACAALALATTAVPATAAGARDLTGSAGDATAGRTVLTASAEAAARVDDVLTTGERLEPGDALVSPSGRYRLQVDTTGLLKLLERESWLGAASEELFAADVAVVVLQGDGNLVAYSPGGQAVLDFGTAGTATTSVRLQDDRNIVMLGADGRVTGDAGTYAGDFLLSPTVLLPGDRATGQNGVSHLLMQPDGNLVLYRGATPLWSSGTFGNPGAGAVFQDDGNLVVYSSAASGRLALWSSGTSGDPYDVALVVEDTEISVLAVQGDSYVARWGSNWTTSGVMSGDELDVGDRRVSPDGRCVLVLQSDLNLVQYCGGRAVFATGVPATEVVPVSVVALMQPDGNLVVYRQDVDPPALIPLYATGSRVPGSRLVVQSDGNLVVVGPDGRPAWSRLTGRLR